ncbi:glycerol-3-phosphate dehydrogenase [Galbibacter marinus]|uniref:Glycerol-3-phosphate dehydrogenase n=1 Tax=Galbibacter marinus TaxID=555500 RepID=K2PU55_9FLAO|nr:glycerol-3-phosphate dehydrogenase [Galbibacter marinus]
MNIKTFSNLNRQENSHEIRNNTYDLIVIGGGITGAGILLDAASRGLKTLLIEKGDYSSGTSSKSTKLIHGGLRYLKQFDFWLVKEVGTERAIVHKLAPHLVQPEKMLLPLVEKGSYGKWLTSIGLKIYDILADVEGEDQRQMLDKKQALEKEPLLPKKILKGAGYYAEYRTDDARLTLEVIKTALRYDAVAINYTEVLEFIYKDNLVKGVKVFDHLLKEEYKIDATHIINATGPWVDDIRHLNKSLQGDTLQLTKGVHLVFPHEKLPVTQSIYFDVPDGRMIFAIPRAKVTYVGTTDTLYNKNKEEVRTEVVDAIYLIEAVNHMFPKVNLTLEDVVSSWAGLRPLIQQEGKSPSELSRKDEIFISPSDLISIAGGKLTGYRKMAERAVDKVIDRIEKHKGDLLKNCHTDTITISGGPWEHYNEVLQYIQKVFKNIEPLGFTQHDAWFLVTTYGKQVEKILKIYDSINEKDIYKRLIQAEFQFCTEYEMIATPSDFFIRRTGRLFFDIQSLKDHLDTILQAYKYHFKVRDSQVEKEKSKLLNAIKNSELH